jgi:hypothetical protein
MGMGLPVSLGNTAIQVGPLVETARKRGAGRQACWGALDTGTLPVRWKFDILNFERISCEKMVREKGWIVSGRQA